MNKILPYEKELSRQLKKLPLPDEDAGWQDMKRRLDEDKDDGVIFFIPLLNGCAGWVLLYGIALTTVLCFLIPGKSATQAKNDMAVTAPTNKTQNKENNSSADTAYLAQRKTQANDNILAENSTRQDDAPIIKEYSPENIYTTVKNKKRPAVKIDNTNGEDAKTAVGKKKLKKIKGKTTSQIKGGETDENETSTAYNETAIKSDYEIAEEDAIATAPIKTVTVKEKADSSLIAEKKPEEKKSEKTDSLAKKEPAKEKTKQNNKIYFAAGAGLWQRIDNIGPKGNAYTPSGNSSGANALKKPFNYVPSVYARMYKGNKWFLQAEFRYKSPKKINNLLYSYSDFTIPFTTTRVITSYYLTDVYFHQLPVTFNYFVTKNWSIGAGISWNKFNSAFAVEERTVLNSVLPGGGTKYREFKYEKSDSTNINIRLTDSYFQGILETQYRWRRFSLGLNYSFGLQPYLNYNPQGTSQRSERNNMLNIFIRYELWKSKQKK